MLFTINYSILLTVVYMYWVNTGTVQQIPVSSLNSATLCLFRQLTSWDNGT